MCCFVGGGRFPGGEALCLRLIHLLHNKSMLPFISGWRLRETANVTHVFTRDHIPGNSLYPRADCTSSLALYSFLETHCKISSNVLKVIYHPLYGMNNYVLIWGDWLSCDPLRGSHDSQSLHIWGDWLVT